MKTGEQCPAERKMNFTHLEVDLRCDMLEGHTTPRHRSILNKSITVFWDK